MNSKQNNKEIVHRVTSFVSIVLEFNFKKIFLALKSTFIFINKINSFISLHIDFATSFSFLDSQKYEPSRVVILFLLYLHVFLENKIPLLSSQTHLNIFNRKNFACLIFNIFVMCHESHVPCKNLTNTEKTLLKLQCFC